MHLDFKEILAAYKARRNPTEFQAMLAEKRLAICSECQEVKTSAVGNVKYCGVCGCVIGGKIFSPKEGACPRGKWDQVDSEVITQKSKEVLQSNKNKLL